MPTEPQREFVQIVSRQYTFDREGDVVEVVRRHSNYIDCRHPSTGNGVWPYPVDAVTPTTFTHAMVVRPYSYESSSLYGIRGVSFRDMYIDEATPYNPCNDLPTPTLAAGQITYTLTSTPSLSNTLYQSYIQSLIYGTSEIKLADPKCKAKPYLSNQGDEAWY